MDQRNWKNANYVLWSLPKGLKFLRAVSAKESPKVMGLKGFMTPMPYGISLVILTALGAAKMDRMRGPSSITWGQYITGWVSFVTNASVVPQWHHTPSSDMDAMPAQIKALSPERAHSAHPIWSPPKEVKVMLFTRPPPQGGQHPWWRRHWLPFHQTSPTDKQLLFISAVTRITSQRHCWLQLRWFSLRIKQNKLHI